ncbi:hypothetical protein ASPACDRAFT_55109 [Aspergillus aculeatus ATCC 16872]|uniref:Major facilitator superfamily (MFS) profile domain-containing protein n=1 Tax=Aspergillus aculeatus (strain ATCC 16872 / CBS 172.66 / WB 5094) TaxID=690307 RepID=A0A1L9WGZ2_ASPA1|nr:uncharacterized protein ASPACDRAFT_55109 [Aspergillus aculeatus ATCC 16872]OJJ95413.1 hypothetical protein ASPACDRAFT_55109 [Aspergillus aculeatus ATCC 16872]
MGTFGSQTSTYNGLVTAFVAVGSMNYGYCSSIISSTIGQPGWYTYFSLPQEGQLGNTAGGAAECLFIMWSCDFFDCKRNIQLGAFLAMFGGALQGAASSLSMFQAGRFICGLGIGILVTVCPIYLSEISGAFRRGWLVVGYACYFAQGQTDTFSWSFPLCLQCLPPLILLLGSPKGKQSEAQSVLERLRNSPDDPDNLVAKEEYYQTTQQIHLEKERLPAYRNVWQVVLKKRSYNFGESLFINNYAVILYTNLGMTGSMPLLLSAVWLTTAGILYNMLGAWLHDRVNSRRKMYTVGFIGIIITISCLAAMTAQYAGIKNQVGNGFGIFFIYLYLAFQGTFCDTTMYLYVSEILPTEIRPIGMGFSLFGQSAASKIGNWPTAPLLTESRVMYFIIPETARLTIEEIAKNFGEEVAVLLTDATDEGKAKLKRKLAAGSHAYQSARTKTASRTVDNSVLHVVYSA